MSARPLPVPIPAQRRAPEFDDLARAAAALHRGLEAAVHAQRLAGASWGSIAKMLGCSRQAAHKRWSYLDGYGVTLVRFDGEPPVAAYVSKNTGAVVGPVQLAEFARTGQVRTVVELVPTEKGKRVRISRETYELLTAEGVPAIDHPVLR